VKVRYSFWRILVLAAESLDSAFCSIRPKVNTLFATGQLTESSLLVLFFYTDKSVLQLWWTNLNAVLHDAMKIKAYYSNE